MTMLIPVNDDQDLRRVSVLEPTTKEVWYSMVAAKLEPGKNYIMRQETLDDIRKTPAGVCVFDITPKSIPLSVGAAYPTNPFHLGISTWTL